MTKKVIWMVGSCLVVVSMLLAACTSAPATQATPSTPATPAAPSTGTNIVSVTLTKKDGTKVVKEYEKPHTAECINTTVLRVF